MTKPRNINDFLSRFDWMQITPKVDPEAAYGNLSLSLGGRLERVRGINGYTAGMTVVRNEETLASVYFGGVNPFPNIKVTSWACDEVVPVMRSLWPGRHEVTRADTAVDFDEAGGFEVVSYVLQKYANTRHIEIQHIESTRNGVRARTVYLGAASSRVRLRAYEKGSKDLQDGLEGSSNAYRVELQVRPTGEVRGRASALSPDALWGVTPWARSLAAEVLKLPVEPVIMQPRREPDYMRAIRALRSQYGSTLSRALEVEGSPEAVLRLLEVIP